MKWIRNILLAPLVVLLALVASIGLVQTYYHLAPVAPSDDTRWLDGEAKGQPTVTENGYRAYGVLAPPSVDLVKFGKCLVQAGEQAKKQVVPQTDADRGAGDVQARNQQYFERLGERQRALAAGCDEGRARLARLTIPPELRITPQTTEAQWQALVALDPSRELVARVGMVEAAGARRLGAGIDAPFVAFDAFTAITRWRIAGARDAWLRGDHDAAIATWLQISEQTTQRAGDSLIEAMIAVAMQTQALLSVQSALERSVSVTGADAHRLHAMLAGVDRLPDVVARSLIWEWQMQRTVVVQIGEGVLPAWGGGGNPALAEKFANWLSRFGYDETDTLNQYARNTRWSMSAIRTAALGHPPPRVPAEWVSFGCDGLGDLAPVCLPYQRNPVGRVLAAIALPLYQDYGLRVADLRNLAAATRLTVAARATGVLPAQMGAFVATAPADQRDVFSGDAFAYDAVARRLKVKLRTKSSTLGDDTYQLAL